MVKNDQITVIIVTFNNEETIGQCLKSVEKYSPRSPIVVLDNNSQDKTTQIIKKFSNVLLIESATNLGFSKANNLAAQEAKTDYLVFLNPDTILLESNDFRKMAKALEGNSGYGLIGPMLIGRSGQILSSVRHFPTVLNCFKEYILGIEGAYDFYLPTCQSLCPVETVVGACLVIKKQTFDLLSGFDEKYFLYFEDLKLCKSIYQLGLKVGYLTQVKICHLVGISSSQVLSKELSYESAKRYHGLLGYLLIEIMSRIRIGKRLHG